ncbi:distal tail protein Dit [Lacticaseibacillus parakribbianus]|uniref:distal tail protein Dit n=1 Tax=Lacticaseibacillus parakribbianus TaxID=2970927 RepID=UPI0021CB31D5|nr:distal tail protein Dit [Lacticaseibacillus parakribbianus]
MTDYPTSPSVHVKYDGVELTEWITISDIQRNIGPNRTITADKIGIVAGKRVISATDDDNVIKITGDMNYSLVAKRRELAAALAKLEPTILTIDDEPDKYYLAIVSEQPQLVEDQFHGEVTITFHVPDGVAHAADERLFPIGADGSVTVSNDGTAETPLDIDVIFTSDANAIGFTSEDNILQFGTPEANSDDSDFVASKVLISDYMEPASKELWTVNAGKIRWRADDGDHTSKADGTLSWQSKLVSVASYGSFDHKTEAGYWHGPTLNKELTEAADNVEAVFFVTFKPSKSGSKCQGLLEGNLVDADGNFIAGFELKDNVQTANAVTYSFFVGDERVNTTALPAKVLKEGSGFYGTATIKKVGNNFTFRLARLNGKTGRETWGSPTLSRVNNTVAMLPTSQIALYGAQWRDFPAMQIEFAHVKVTKINTEDDTLIPLTFTSGDELHVDGETNQVYINGVRNDSYRVLGSSQMLKVGKGDTTIYAMSDGTFSGTLTEREKYL